MRAMSSHILAPGTAQTVGALASAELSRNIGEVGSRTNWSPSERSICIMALGIETALCRATPALVSRCDSIRGDDDMTHVYPTYCGQLTDVVSLDASSVLKLSEMKYAIKVGGVGMFRNARTFQHMVSNKFLDMGAALSSDGEAVSALRILVVNRQQLPFSIARIRSILGGTRKKGSFSRDGNEYDYVLCSSDYLRQMIDNPPVGTTSSSYFFFTI